MTVTRRCALVESPAQLLNVLELDRAEPAADNGSTARSERTRVAVLAPADQPTRTQLRAMTSLARQAGHEVSWFEPRLGGGSVAGSLRAMVAELGGVDRLVVGDPFSGIIQLIINLVRPSKVTIVDDGTATLEFARQWSSGEPLTRWHHRPGAPRVTSLVRGQIAGSLRRRLSPDGGCALRLFTAMPVILPGVEIVPNRYEWVRSRHHPPMIKSGADLAGTSLVESGVLDEDAYLETVASLASSHGVDRYFAHRKESARKLRKIVNLGLRVAKPLLPLELVARRGPIGSRVLSFPSTVVHTLPVVLAGTTSEVVVCTPSQAWYSPASPPRADAFLAGVTRSARGHHGLAAVAC